MRYQPTKKSMAAVIISALYPGIDPETDPDTWGKGALKKYKYLLRRGLDDLKDLYNRAYVALEANPEFYAKKRNKL